MVKPKDPPQTDGHVILFEHTQFRGAHKHVFIDVENLNDPVDDSFNDLTSSIVILEGNWEFFKDSGYHHKLGETLGPGAYNAVSAYLEADADNRISSLRPV